ncbi:fasciclin-3 isoform X3 [Euwallacea fornicatus]|uniref:fasciclin-3 isoform X3 n=1 Tax=Euwallacea fornicatus TaxID=995702 RepID=UPI00338DD154
MELVFNGRMLLVAAMGFFFIQGLLAAKVDVDKKEQTVLVGDPVTYMCRVAVPLQYCRVEIPGLRSFNLNKGMSNADVAYVGEGLEYGQCGFTMYRVKDNNNGEIKCTLGITNEPQESVGAMSLIVARKPQPPELDISRGADHVSVYKVDDLLQATCLVRDGRPVANISWFLGDDPIDLSELTMPTVLDLAKENLQSKVQNLTRRLQASDSGKYLRCVAYHPAYPDGQAETKRALDIKYAPLPQRQQIEEFGYEIGKAGSINVTVQANPRPTFEWSVNGQRIKEGSNDNTGIMMATLAEELGNGEYRASLRIARIGKQDTEKEYILTAYNDQGSETYKVKISTNPEPKGYEGGVVAVIGIVVAILFVILTVSLLIFAKLNGRWCFSEKGESRYIAESSDTESADVRPKETKCRLPSIQLTSALFKKKHDKVAVEEEPSVRVLDPDEGDTATITAEDQAKEAEVATKTAEGKNEAKDKGLVYAELDLVRTNSPTLVAVVKNADEKTEYAEIVYSPAKENEDEGADKK